MSDDTRDYHVVAKLRFNIRAKSTEHARVIVENGVSSSVRLGIPIGTEVTVLGEVRPNPIFDTEDLE